MIIGIFEKGTLSGGSFVSERNKRFLNSFANNELRSCEILYTDNSRCGFINRFCIVFFGVEVFVLFELFRLIFKNKKTKIDLWLDRSTMGFILLLIKLTRMNINAHIYVHNDEYKYHYDKFEHEYVKSTFYHKFLLLLIKSQQAISMAASCKRYFISALEAGYMCPKKSKIILPPTWSEYANRTDKNILPFSDSNQYVLLVGSNFFANLSGFNDYIKIVCPMLEMKSIFIGKDLLKAGFKAKNIEVYENVNSLIPFYASSQMVIVPISKGAGLKVKLVEALYYGKKVICTEHAACGLEVNLLEKFYKRGQLIVSDIENMAVEVNKEYKSEPLQFENDCFCDMHYIDRFSEYFCA